MYFVNFIALVRMVVIKKWPGFIPARVAPSATDALFLMIFLKSGLSSGFRCLSNESSQISSFFFATNDSRVVLLSMYALGQKKMACFTQCNRAKLIKDLDQKSGGRNDAARDEITDDHNDHQSY